MRADVLRDGEKIGRVFCTDIDHAQERARKKFGPDTSAANIENFCRLCHEWFNPNDLNDKQRCSDCADVPVNTMVPQLISGLVIDEYKRKERRRAVVHRIIQLLPVPDFDIDELRAQFEYNPGGLVDHLAELGIYNPRVPYHRSSGDVYLSEPMNGIPVPTVQHLPDGRVEVWEPETA